MLSSFLYLTLFHHRFDVSAMPTFVVVKGGEVVDSVRGANGERLREMVKGAVSEDKEEEKEVEKDDGGDGDSNDNASE